MYPGDAARPPTLLDPAPSLPRHPAELPVRRLVRIGHRNDLCRRDAVLESRAAARASAGARPRGSADHAGRGREARGRRLAGDDHATHRAWPARLLDRRRDGVRGRRRIACATRARNRAGSRSQVQRRAPELRAVRAHRRAPGPVDAAARPRAAAREVRGRRRARHGSLRVPYDGHGRARDDRAYARLRVDCDDSPLVLLHEPAHESAALDADGGMVRGARLRTRGARPRARRRAVPKVDAVQLREVDSLPGLDAVALHPRRVLRRVRADMGVQRFAVDGAVRMDERRGPAHTPKRLHGRSARRVAIRDV